LYPVPDDNDDDDDDECGAIGGMRIGRGNRSTRTKPTPMPLCPPQIPHGLGLEPGLPHGKPATNCMSYGTAYSFNLLIPKHASNNPLIKEEKIMIIIIIYSFLS
jgi:hypothetical protein